MSEFPNQYWHAGESYWAKFAIEERDVGEDIIAMLKFWAIYRDALVTTWTCLRFRIFRRLEEQYWGYCSASPHADVEDVSFNLSEMRQTALNGTWPDAYRTRSVSFVTTKLWRIARVPRRWSQVSRRPRDWRRPLSQERSKIHDAINFAKAVFINLSVAARALSFRSIVIEDMDDYVNRADPLSDKSGKRTPISRLLNELLFFSQRRAFVSRLIC